jgi:hypothetical protein
MATGVDEKHCAFPQIRLRAFDSPSACCWLKKHLSPEFAGVSTTLIPVSLSAASASALQIAIVLYPGSGEFFMYPSLYLNRKK